MYLSLDIEGMNCPNRAQALEAVLQEIPGMKQVRMKPDRQCAEVNMDSTITEEELRGIIDHAGYTLSGISPL